MNRRPPLRIALIPGGTANVLYSTFFPPPPSISKSSTGTAQAEPTVLASLLSFLSATPRLGPLRHPRARAGAPARPPNQAQALVDGFEKAAASSRAKPEPGFDQWLWPGLGFGKAKASSGLAKAGASRPSRAGTSLAVGCYIHPVLNKHASDFQSSPSHLHRATHIIIPARV